VLLKPEGEWRRVHEDRWYSQRAPEWMKKGLRFVWPDERPISWEELRDELDARLQLPGVTNAWTMPIKARIDMLTTGIRTPVGIKVFGPDLKEIEQIWQRLETVLKGARHPQCMQSAPQVVHVDIVRGVRKRLATAGLCTGAGHRGDGHRWNADQHHRRGP
jgi:Cu/Ag efflux pump CusA